jgi:hypothetical protein
VKPAGETQIFAHLSRPFVEHCYALFAVYTLGGTTTERAVVSATPFDATAPNLVAWTYSAGGSSPNVVPPTVGPDAVYTVSTDGVVHAMSRGETGGTWPTGWNPVGLGKAAHNRSPVVPLAYGPRLFVGTESGEVHAVNGLNGATAWSRSSRFAGSQLPNVGGAQGTPAGLFKAFSGLNDVLLVGANLTSSNTFFMLNPVTGADVSPYSHGSMGSVLGMPVVDYAGNRVHFVTTLPAGVLWTFDLGAAGAPSLTPSTLGGPNPLGMAYGSNSSPVLRNGRLYFGLTDGELIPYRLSDGAGASSPLALADGQVKGFVFPDRRNNWLYLSTGTKVWGVKDTVDPTAPSLVPWWFAAIPSPSPVLHWPNTNYLYVGGGNGCLYQLDVSLASPATTKKSVLLDSGWQIGAPSLDGPNGLALVGSLSGVVFAVRVPFATEECP